MLCPRASRKALWLGDKQQAARLQSSGTVAPVSPSPAARRARHNTRGLPSFTPSLRTSRFQQLCAALASCRGTLEKANPCKAPSNGHVERSSELGQPVCTRGWGQWVIQHPSRVGARLFPARRSRAGAEQP